MFDWTVVFGVCGVTTFGLFRFRNLFRHSLFGIFVSVRTVVRGASWVTEEVSMMRCAYRHKVPPDTYAYSIGFRIVCTDH